MLKPGAEDSRINLFLENPLLAKLQLKVLLFTCCNNPLGDLNVFFWEYLLLVVTLLMFRQGAP